jgi:DNA repair exonuclease SbcCD nuclease subunit
LINITLANILLPGIVGSEDNHRFTDTWDLVYSGSYLQIPWFVVAGNHDHLGNVTAQISYSALNDRWNFPALYYSKNFVTHDVSLQVIFIDTVDLAGIGLR